jgi:hypothetical protein
MKQKWVNKRQIEDRSNAVLEKKIDIKSLLLQIAMQEIVWQD